MKNSELDLDIFTIYDYTVSIKYGNRTGLLLASSREDAIQRLAKKYGEDFVDDDLLELNTVSKEYISHMVNYVLELGTYH